MSENFQFANSFDFHGLLLSDAFAVSPPGTIFWIWTKNSSRNTQNKKLKAILFMIITNSIHKTNCEKWCSWPILQFFSSLRCLLGVGQKCKKHKNSITFTFFFWFLNLHNLLERACDHTKLYIFWKYTWTCV